MKLQTIKLSGILILLTAGLAFGQNDRNRSLSQYRTPDQGGVNQFEALDEEAEFDGVNVRLGGSFALQFQALQHSSNGLNSDSIPLVDIGNNFNLPTANLDLDVALAQGVRAHIRTYLSSRHHPESWVKGGYVQISELDFISEDFLQGIMDITTVKIGLMEINYGDYHFRRSDNARAIYNPFVGNLILDAFNTEMGAEVYFTPGDFLIMGGITNGNLNQSVLGSDQTPAFLGKLGYDRQFNQDFRARLTGSIYSTPNGQTNFLYSGDRAGSRYYMVMEPEVFMPRGSNSFDDANPTDNYTSGRFNPSFVNEVTAVMINPFVKWRGLEFFGTYEMSSGKIGATDAGEPETRSWTQMHGELLYRFGENEDIYVGGKYNRAEGGLPNFNPNANPTDVSIDRFAFAAGWYMTDNVMLKAEYVEQTYDGFATNNVLNGGKFNGVMLEAVLSF